MSTADPAPTPSTRQWLSKRQSATVDALLDAALEVLREVGYADLSIRDVATCAGVTHTTAYNYFTGKDHLLAELLRRMLRERPTPAMSPDATLGERLAEALRAHSDILTDEPALAEALLVATVSIDPDIKRIRDTIGADIVERIRSAVGEDADPRVAEGALFLYSGAMLQAGLGYFTFDDAVTRIGAIADLWDQPG